VQRPDLHFNSLTGAQVRVEYGMQASIPDGPSPGMSQRRDEGVLFWPLQDAGTHTSLVGGLYPGRDLISQALFTFLEVDEWVDWPPG
jgi:hypothetical protein